MSSYDRITHLTAETIEVTRLIVDGTPYAPGTVTNVTVEEHHTVGSTPVPAQLDRADFGERPTCKELAQAYHDLYDALTRAGYIEPKAVPQEAPAEAPQSAPTPAEVFPPAPATAEPTQATPQAVSAGVVDGA